MHPMILKDSAPHILVNNHLIGNECNLSQLRAYNFWWHFPVWEVEVAWHFYLLPASRCMDEIMDAEKERSINLLEISHGTWRWEFHFSHFPFCKECVTPYWTWLINHLVHFYHYSCCCSTSFFHMWCNHQAYLLWSLHPSYTPPLIPSFVQQSSSDSSPLTSIYPMVAFIFPWRFGTTPWTHDIPLAWGTEWVTMMICFIQNHLNMIQCWIPTNIGLVEVRYSLLIKLKIKCIFKSITKADCQPLQNIQWCLIWDSIHFI